MTFVFVALPVIRRVPLNMWLCAIASGAGGRSV